MITSILALIIITSTLLFGAVEIWPSTAVLALVYTLGLIWVLKQEYAAYRAPLHTKLLIVTGFAFTLYAVLQTIPLPLVMLKYLSPGSSRLREFYAFGPADQGAISLIPYRSLLEVLKVVAFLTVFSIAAIYFISRDRLKGFIIALSLFGFCLAVFAIVQKATWNGRLYWVRDLTMGGVPFGPFVNRNHFAGFIGMIIPLTLGLAITKHSREKKILYGFLAVIMSVALFFSLSRGGIVSFFSGMGLFGLLLVASRLQQKKVWIIGVFIIAVLTYLVWLGMDPILQRFAQTDITREQRIIVWSTTFTAAKDFWLTGSGLGTFLHIFPLYAPASVQGGIYDHAHNDYIEFLLETGLGGIMLLVCFTGLLLWNAFRSTFEDRAGIMLMAALASAMTMAVHSIFDFNLHILSNLLLFGIVLGMIAALSDTDDPHPSRETMQKQRDRAPASQDSDSGTPQEALPFAGKGFRVKGGAGAAAGAPRADDDGKASEAWKKEYKKNR